MSAGRANREDFLTAREVGILVLILKVLQYHDYHGTPQTSRVMEDSEVNFVPLTRLYAIAAAQPIMYG